MAKLHVTSAERRATLRGNAGPVDQAEEAAVKVAGQQVGTCIVNNKKGYLVL